MADNVPAELNPGCKPGISARADCSRARISARGNIYVLSARAQLSGDVPEARSAEGTVEIRRGGTDLR